MECIRPFLGGFKTAKDAKNAKNAKNAKDANPRELAFLPSRLGRIVPVLVASQRRDATGQALDPVVGGALLGRAGDLIGA
jgi:hypothetical protein